MSWNYRLIKMMVGKPPTLRLGLHEVYYDDEGRPHSWTTHPEVDAFELDCDDEVPTDESMRKVVIHTLEMMLRDIRDTPILATEVGPDGKEHLRPPTE